MPAQLFSKSSQIVQSVVFIQCLMILTIMCFRCKGWRQQLPGPVGVHQWYHRSDGTRVKGTQLSGIPALLWGTAIMWWVQVFSPYICLSCCFQHMPVRLLSPPLRVAGGKERERLVSILTLFYMRAATDVSLNSDSQLKTGTYPRYMKDAHWYWGYYFELW